MKSFSRSYGFPVVYCYLAVVQHELEEERAALENFRQALEILSRAYEHPELVETLEWLAIYCADLEQWSIAGHYIAAINALRQISDIIPPVPYRARWTETKERVKINLPAADYREACEEVQTVEQVALPEYALENLAAINLGSQSDLSSFNN